MEDTLDEELFEVLNYLDIYRRVQTLDSVTLDADQAELRSRLETLEANGLVRGTWEITPAGREVVAAKRERIVEPIDRNAEFLDLVDEFERVGSEFKSIVTEYQLRRSDTPDGDGDPPVPIESLERVHRDVTAILEALPDALPQIDRYARSLGSALTQLEEGNPDYLATRPDSYHSLWHELHEYLLRLSKRERRE